MSVEPVQVRFAMPDDLAFVGEGSGIAPEIMRRKIDEREVVVAERGGRLVGQARLEYLWSKIPYLALIRVREGERRTGVGQALLAFVETFLQQQGHAALYSSSQVDEPAPQAWHRHVGFVECGSIAGINPGGIGEVFFRKPLS
ncbi:MAG: GNAT family N-acetyltransferase [Chloroflexota bacterium]